ncbi:7405_t:CDS:2, partial [Acaulospora colombiana]
EVFCNGNGDNENHQWRIQLINKPIKYGSTVVLAHAQTQKYRNADSQQNMVVGTDQEIDFKKSLWMITGTHGANVKIGDTVPSNTIIRFENRGTAGYLHFHHTLNGTMFNQQQ